MYLNIAICYAQLNDIIKTKRYAQLAIKTISRQNLTVETINIYCQISTLYTSKNTIKML